MASGNVNGRSYHDAHSPYLLPNDATEHERLNLQHRGLDAMMHDRPIHAPLSSPDRMLDIGCGTGAMSLRLAKNHPKASSIIGIDLSPVTMKDAEKPSNVSFLQGDIRETKSTHPELAPESFDYVFSRLLVYGMTKWPAYIARTASLLKPGAWVEMQEVQVDLYDAQQNLISSDWKWVQDQHPAWSALGLDLRAGSKLGQRMRDAGLVDVEMREYRLVFGRWAGHPETDMIGAYAVKYLGDLNGMAYRKALSGRMSEEEMERDLAQMGEDLGGRVEGMYMPFYVAWGRKAA